jgi:16S rRNA (adenine1518-N6/adenine1519-N6)-dimethyltransferase
VKRGQFHKEDVILEIGAGLGALTVPLARTTKHVLAVEPDQKIAALLENELLAAKVSNVTVIKKDILHCDMEAMGRTAPRPLRVIGNLPYHISSQVLVHLMGSRRSIVCALLMFQKEVADRLLAKTGTKAYGRLSVSAQYCASIAPVAQVAASSFYPRPKVDSTVVRITFFDAPPFPAKDEFFLFQVIRAAFGKRRKTLRNALAKSELGFKEAQILAALEATNIDPARRAETLTVEDFVLLAGSLRRRRAVS